MYKLLCLVLMGLLSGTPRALCQELAGAQNLIARTRAEQILTRARQAKGIADRVRAFTIISQTADMIDGRLWQIKMTRHFTTSFQMRTDSLYPESGKRRNTGLSGEQGWIEEDGQVTLDNSTAIERKKRIVTTEWWVDFLRVLPGQDSEFLALEDVTLKNQPHEVLAATIGEVKLILYFAKTTHLLTKVESEFALAERSYHFEEWYSDYRWVQGVRLAHRISTYVDGRMQAQTFVRRYLLNRPLKAARYASP